MDLKLLNISVVVLSEGNNPKLLNHDFLARNSIVSEQWEIQDIVVTPPFSQLLYKNGLQFIVEINRLQIKVHQPEILKWENDLPKMAADYLDLLPHVSYKGVGINASFKVANASDRYYAGFLKEGPWWHSMGGLTGASLELHYNNRTPQLNVKVEDQSQRTKGKRNPALVLSANYHHDFSPEQEQKRKEYIFQVPELVRQFHEFAQDLPLE